MPARVRSKVRLLKVGVGTNVATLTDALRKNGIFLEGAIVAPVAEELPELSREYLEIRNAQMRTENLAAEVQLAERREELIEKCLVENQAAYLLVALRQAILNVPYFYARKMVGLKDQGEARKILREMAISVLNEIKDLPAKVTNPHWLDELEEKR